MSCFCGNCKDTSMYSTYEILFWPNAPVKDQIRCTIDVCSKRCAMLWTFRYAETSSFSIEKHVSGTDWLLGNFITKEEFRTFRNGMIDSFYNR